MGELRKAALVISHFCKKNLSMILHYRFDINSSSWCLNKFYRAVVTKCNRLDCLTNRHFFMVLETRSLSWKVELVPCEGCEGKSSSKPPSLACQWLSSPCVLPLYLSVSSFLFLWGHQSHWVRFPLITSFELNYLCKNTICKYILM